MVHLRLDIHKLSALDSSAGGASFDSLRCFN